MERPHGIVLIAEGRYLSQAQPTGLYEELRGRGVAVRVVNPESPTPGACDLRAAGWIDGAEGCVARGRSDAVLAALGEAERRGVPVLNPSSSIRRVVDKAAMGRELARAGVPIPLTWAGDAAGLVDCVPAGEYPVIAKPAFGDNCRGVQVCDGPAELAALASGDAARTGIRPGETILVQPYLATDGFDLKLYGVGRHAWAIRKPSPMTGIASGARPHSLALSPTLRSLAERCGEIFELDLWGVDCIETPAGPLVIEVNEYPNYTGVAGASGAIADLLLARAGAPRPVGASQRKSPVLSRMAPGVTR